MCVVEAFICNSSGCPSILEVFAKMGQIAFGIAAVIIAIQQWKISRNRAKFELYEKRLETFKAVEKYLGSVLRNGQTSTQDIIDLRWKFNENYFLYDRDIRDYIEDIYMESFEMLRLQRKLTGNNSLPVGTERNKVAELESEKLKWLTDQITVSRGKFDKYLRIE